MMCSSISPTVTAEPCSVPPHTPVCSAQPPPAPLPQPGAPWLGRALLPHPILRPPAHPGTPTPWPAGETPTRARTVSCSKKPGPLPSLLHAMYSRVRETCRSHVPWCLPVARCCSSPGRCLAPLGTQSPPSDQEPSGLPPSTAAHAVCSNTIPRCSVLSPPPSPQSSLHAK